MELKAYVEPLRKWWWLILAATLIAGATSYYVVSQQPPVYEARATLMIGSAITNPNPTGGEFYLSQQLAQTYTDIARRDVVRQSVMDELGLERLPAYSARALPDTQLIEIVVTDTSPERAMVVANQLANQLILQTPTGSEQQEEQARQVFIKEQLDDLEVKIDETKAEIEVKREELAGLFSARQIAETQGQINALEAKLNTLQGNYAALLASTKEGAVNSLSVVESATVPRFPVGPEIPMTVLTAAAVGLALAVGAAYLLEFVDDSVRTASDVERATELPTLAAIARHRASRDGQITLITSKSPRSSVSEGFRALRTAILFSDVDHELRTLMVTSGSPGEGKSLTAANLATVLAQANHKVLLVDADLRRPTQHRIFQLSRNFGLTNLLVNLPTSEETNAEGKTPGELLEEYSRTTQQENLYVLSSGPLPPNPAEVVGSAKMKALREAAAKHFDFVVFDTPPILAVTDAVVLGSKVDTVVLVADSGRTRRGELRRSMEKLREVNAQVAGVVLNRLSSKEEGYYYYAYESKTYHDNESELDLEPGLEPAGARGTGKRGFVARVRAMLS